MQSSTLIAVFDDYQAAERAVRSLTDAGIARDAISLQSNFKTGAAGRTDYDEQQHEGGISGFFHRLFGGSHDDSSDYAEAVRRGSTVVSVAAPAGQEDRVADLLNQAGAIDIDRRVAGYRETGYEKHDPNARPYSLDEAARERESFGKQPAQSIPVVEEELQVGKRAVRRGGVRVYSQVIEQPVENEVTLREEHVRVERRPVDRPLEPGEASRLRDQSIEVHEMAEEPVIQKRARVREEVVVGKETTERKENVRDTVRRTQVKVDQLGTEAAGNADYRNEFRRDYDRNYATSGVAYEEVEPAYDYGYRMASDSRYKGRSWDQVENDLRTDYDRTYPGGTWEKMKNAVRYGWDRVTGRRP